MSDKKPSQEGKELTMLAITALVKRPEDVEAYVQHLLAFHDNGGITLHKPEAVLAALEAWQAGERMKLALRDN